MFDSVGRDLDDEALKRGAQSAGLLSLLAGGGLAVFFLAGLYVVQETELLPVLEDMVMAEVLEEDNLEAPPPPPPPPPPAAADASTEEEEEETPTPDEMVEKVEELKQEVKEEMKSDAKPAGVVGGQEGGVAGGVVGGVQGGVVGGVVGGQLGGGAPPKYKVVRQSEIEWKTQPMPAYPDAARGLGFGDTACKATIALTAEGLVEEVKVNADCPKVFQGPLRDALTRWKAYPYRVDGNKVAVQFTGLFTFKEH
jgi:protein TonB